MQPILSSLRPTLRNRAETLQQQLYRLEYQRQSQPVQLLWLGDNKSMTVGAKRNKLLSIADGDWITFVDDDDVVNSDSFESGFNLPRAKLIFSGTVGDPNFIYKIQGNFSRATGAFVLEDAYVGHDLDDGWLLLWGQLRLPVQL